MSTASSGDEKEVDSLKEGEAVDKGSVPGLYNFTESSGYKVGDLEEAYDILEGNYWADEDEEKVVVPDSTWSQVQDSLEGDSEQEEVSEWRETASEYLFENDSNYMKAGLGGSGAGLLSGALGYTLAGDLLLTGGALSLGWGITSYLGKRVKEYVTEDEEPEEIESELTEYEDWDLEIVNMEEYGRAITEHREE